MPVFHQATRPLRSTSSRSSVSWSETKSSECLVSDRQYTSQRILKNLTLNFDHTTMYNPLASAEEIAEYETATGS